MTNQRHLLVLIHGLGRRAKSLAWTAAQAEGEGYETVLVSYASQSLKLEETSELVQAVLSPYLEAAAAGSMTISFLTHSLGGLVWRQWLKSCYCWPERKRPAWLGRTVMLAPPSQGALVADAIGGEWWAQLILGPVISQLRTDGNGIAQALGPVPSGVGVIMGDQVLMPLLQGPLSSRKNDGIVDVESGHIEGEDDFLVMPADHTFIMRRPKVMGQALHFLKMGRFFREN